MWCVYFYSLASKSLYIYYADAILHPKASLVQSGFIAVLGFKQTFFSVIAHIDQLHHCSDRQIYIFPFTTSFFYFQIHMQKFFSVPWRTRAGMCCHCSNLLLRWPWFLDIWLKIVSSQCSVQRQTFLLWGLWWNRERWLRCHNISSERN